MERLHFLSQAIKHASANRSETQLLSFERDEDSLFCIFAMNYVKKLFPNARKSLREHLGSSIARRRFKLLSKQQHAQRISAFKEQEHSPVVQGKTPQQSTHTLRVKDMSRDQHSHGLSSQRPFTPGLATETPRMEASTMKKSVFERVYRQGLTSSIPSSTFSRQDSKTAAEYPPPPCLRDGKDTTNARVPCPFCLEPLQLIDKDLKKEPNTWTYVFGSSKRIRRAATYITRHLILTV